MVEPANDLEKSLMKAAINPAARPQFLRDLLKADILVIQSEEDSPNVVNNVLQKGAQLKIQPVEKDGQSWLPIFSSLERLQRHIHSNVTYMQLKAKDFFGITRGAYVVLDPGFDYGKEFLPEEIERMLDGSIFKPTQTYVAEKETQVLIGQPAVYPNQLVKALSEYFATNTAVNRAYLVHFHNPEMGEKPHLLVGIDAAGNREEILGDAGMIAQDVMGEDEIVDFMREDVSDPARTIFSGTEPFYQK